MSNCAIVFLSYLAFWLAIIVTSTDLSSLTGDEAFDLGNDLYKTRDYENSANAFWHALTVGGKEFTPEDALQKFIDTFQQRKILDQGYVTIASKFFDQRQFAGAISYAEKALEVNPKSVRAHIIMGSSMKGKDDAGVRSRAEHFLKAIEIEPNNAEAYKGLAHIFWDLSNWKDAMIYFGKTYELDKSDRDSLSAAVYLRQYVCNWGVGGKGYDQDNRLLEEVVREEMRSNMRNRSSVSQLSCIHPHMTLGYNINSTLKLVVAQSHARAELVLVENAGLRQTDHRPLLDDYREESEQPGFRIKVGYVSANIKSKTTVYMAQDLWRFHDRKKFEVHVYATTPPDNPEFLRKAMRGVDWRKKIERSVEYFHDTHTLDVVQLAQLIRGHGIHILLNWDGYSNNGVRATGLFPLQVAPLQLGHQEYIGSMGADYIQYIVTDKVASPEKYEHLYTEKFIWMPHTFHANSMPHMGPEMTPPLKKLPPSDNPQVNGCGDKPAKFVYCNFNKHLKFSPEVFRQWLRILKAVDGSVLCLLENPTHSEDYLRSFIRENAPDLQSRVRFQPFIGSPYDNQKRNARFCSVILDTPIYNGHTTAVDALWAGVPVISRDDGVEMSSRVGVSILNAAGMTELITRDAEEYEALALKLGKNKKFYEKVRSKLVDTCLQRNPRNPYWDIHRYVKNMERGFTMVWENFLLGNPPKHVTVEDAGPQPEPSISSSSKKKSKSKTKKRKAKGKKKVSEKISSKKGGKKGGVSSKSKLGSSPSGKGKRKEL